MGMFEKCLKRGKWPIHWDERPYHTLRYKGVVVKGNRDMMGRFDWLRIPKDLSGKMVLDMGCNAGEVSKECFDRGAKVIGFDCDKAVLKLARQVNPGPEYYLANINRYPHGFGKISRYEYDIVLCLSVINHVHVGKFLKFVHRLKWKTMIFEGHQTTYNRRIDIKRLFGDYPWKLEYIGMSNERLSRPLCVLTAA